MLHGLARTAGDEGVALRSLVLSWMVVTDLRQVPFASRPKLARVHFSWEERFATAGASTQAPKYLAPQATQEGPKGPRAIASRHSWCLFCGTTTDLTAPSSLHARNHTHGRLGPMVAPHGHWHSLEDTWRPAMPHRHYGFSRGHRHPLEPALGQHRGRRQTEEHPHDHWRFRQPPGWGRRPPHGSR